MTVPYMYAKKFHPFPHDATFPFTDGSLLKLRATLALSGFSNADYVTGTRTAGPRTLQGDGQAISLSDQIYFYQKSIPAVDKHYFGASFWPARVVHIYTVYISKIALVCQFIFEDWVAIRVRRLFQGLCVVANCGLHGYFGLSFVLLQKEVHHYSSPFGEKYKQKYQ